MTPKRIQRKRTAGYVQPPNTKYMGRKGRVQSIWANEHKITPEVSREQAVELHKKDLENMKADSPTGFEKLLDILDGYENLSCFCPLDKPCHVDNWLYFLRLRKANNA